MVDLVAALAGATDNDELDGPHPRASPGPGMRRFVLA
jgi:hypothetical protein